MIYQVLYISTATAVFKASELESLLMIARSQNHKKDITGMLIFHGGGFIQFLEGDEKEVSKLMQKIKNDHRHREFTVIAEATSQNRAFADWDMAFKYINKDELSNYPALQAHVLGDAASDLESDALSAFLSLSVN